MLEPFKASDALSLGVELELQLVSRLDYDLGPFAEDLLGIVNKRKHPGDIKPEITRSMIEMSTGIQHRHDALVAELREIRDLMVSAAETLNIGIAGGGTHPFQHWASQRIYSGERFDYISDLYGYLAKQFTVFGQHVHVGCPSPDEALFLLHCLSRYVPHFIALSASSPFVQGIDTGFSSARLNSVFAFPLSGRAPLVDSWNDFNAYFEKMTATGVVKSMKDFYWDIRPKPEFGTIEVRVCDTPLTVDHAADIACYIQALCRMLMIEQPYKPAEDDYLVYNFNRFQACRFGLDATIVDPKSHEHRPIRDDLLATLSTVEQHAIELGADTACARLRDRVRDGISDARWCRERYAHYDSMNELARAQAKKWMRE